MRKKENLSFAIPLMNLEDNVLSEISQTKKKRQILHNLTYMWNLEKSKS